MIILCESYGNHSNRLFQTIHYEAFCLEHGIPFFNPTFSDMARIFPAIKAHPADILGRPLHALQKVKMLNRLLNMATPKSEEELLSLCGRKIVFVGGWDFRVPELTRKYRSVLASKYAVSDLNNEEASTLRKMENWKEAGHLVTGVHIRRGDYKTWENGRYYFDDPTYQSYMDQVTALAERRNQKACFIIFSNEAVSFEPAENVIISRCRWHVDHHIMKNCNYLVGPPSTFTLWASYTGSTKYYHFKSNAEHLDLDNFSICDG